MEDLKLKKMITLVILVEVVEYYKLCREIPLIYLISNWKVNRNFKKKINKKNKRKVIKRVLHQAFLIHL